MYDAEKSHEALTFQHPYMRRLTMSEGHSHRSNTSRLASSRSHEQPTTGGPSPASNAATCPTYRNPVGSINHV